MLRICQKYVLVFIFSVFFLTNAQGISWSAVNLDMGQIRSLYEKEKGQPWEKAAPEEQQIFIQDVKERKEYQVEIHYKGKDENKRITSEVVEELPLYEVKKEKAPYPVRLKFEQETGRSWESASEKEQSSFWKSFVANEKAEKREEAKRLREKESEKLKVEREQQKKDRELAKKIEQRKRIKEKELREEEKNRREEKRKMEEAKRKMERMRRESKK